MLNRLKHRMSHHQSDPQLIQISGYGQLDSNQMSSNTTNSLNMHAAAEIQKEVLNKVVVAVKASARLLEEQSGVEPSLTDSEIQNHLEMVVQELRDTRIPRS